MQKDLHQVRLKNFILLQNAVSVKYIPKRYERRGGGNLAKELFPLQKGHCRSCSDFGIM